MRLNSRRGVKLTGSTTVTQAAGPVNYAFQTPSSARIPFAESQAGEAGTWQNPTSSQKAHCQGDGVSDDYRSSHRTPGYGELYNKTHESGYYGALWEKIERSLVLDVLRPMGGAGRTCLDFACGTGRITNIAAELFGEVVGVDVSESMLACAQVPQNVRLRHIDMTTQPLGETFDVITAFRFFLNAEDRLKWEALKAINEQLKDDGRFVCNVHMNATSPIGLVCRLLNRLSGRTIRNTLSAARFNEFLSSSGFVVEAMIPYGYLPRPGSLLPGVCEALIEPVEKASRTLRVPGQLAQHFLVVAKKR
ncbi:class I SAM-dependent methyltransferase [Mesorhizobium sp. AR07]|uniref:class I SAM-dependent methyltransferase n=1 Tax=Mesorhizobium sp. AR07 TaxID=2865838 RepID=UPI00215EFCFE|nr:class I SAM-dependent methyltransferase [Mesorhizobium sp. AR07]UVK44035.1 class I SAM-dependent methyltransferase [Mesorhizobium sp. AR07]